MNKSLLIWGAIFGIIAIVLGAFAAHGLKPILSVEKMQTFETGVRYQMYHALFLLFLGGLPVASEKVKRICFYLTLFGVFFFSGSIYLLATNSLTSFDFTVIALITPLGGLLMIFAWIVLLISFFKLKKK
ncbi:DUF423 domain-containing protein [Salinimicrobium sediminilitoris]|uniref:DUF423 domain-containing protein n=1 Tax=Salinimicrobium sediminilitoris TaxID=2876715 RepID=UPI001E2AC530|nr:DUF423 domain-containing protein [Salinimicrobium sediminilitoris]MCC8360960.1 DUF423 domain-containing protein [Salinimicrobium sediminilitoris]